MRVTGVRNALETSTVFHITSLKHRNDPKRLMCNLRSETHLGNVRQPLVELCVLDADRAKTMAALVTSLAARATNDIIAPGLRDATYTTPAKTPR